jgi:hypothetical protein
MIAALPEGAREKMRLACLAAFGLLVSLYTPREVWG